MIAYWVSRNGVSKFLYFGVPCQAPLSVWRRRQNPTALASRGSSMVTPATASA
jgi:hypothetical protein